MDDVSDLVTAIDALLPQTQCTRCGYAGCRPYAEAVAARAAGINQCPPGGADTIAALAELLGRDVEALNPANGVEAPPRVAVIDPATCIGCAKCLPACPVDAIVGARQRLHLVIESECSGCELCIAPCPVDCIAMVPPRQGDAQLLPIGTLRARAGVYRERYAAHLGRKAARSAARHRELEAHRLVTPQDSAS